MSSRAVVGVALAVGLSACVGFAACSGAGPAPSPTPAGPAASAPMGSLPSSSAATTPAPADAGVDAAARALGYSRCTAPRGRILNHPDGGVVFNNAMTSADAGALDRSQAVLDALASELERFQCCFDPWLEAHPEQQARLMLQLTLARDGRVQATSVDPARSNVADSITLSCVQQVAAATHYPASPRGTSTRVDYPFIVGAPAK